MCVRLGIDLGGTKIEIIALDEKGIEILRRRVATPQGNYQQTLYAITELVRGVEAELGHTDSVGIGTPGAISRATGKLKNSNSVALNGQPIVQDLETLLHRKIQISNDANCFALSEATDGAAAGADVVFGVILGTGVGGGIVVHGKALTGPNSIAGEWGHNPLPWPQPDELPGPACYCGKHGCIETFLSGPGMMKLHAQATIKSTVRAEPVEARNSIQPSTGSGRTEVISPADIVISAAQGDAACEHTMQQYENRLACALANVINILDPDVIVLGGGMSNIDRLYQNVPRLLEQWVFSDRVDTRLVKNQFGDSSGVRGAAWL